MHLIYNGVKSTDFGLYLREDITITQPERRIEYINVPGRDGDIIIDQGGRKDIKGELKCYVKDAAMLPQALAYLQGSGRLVISTDPGHEYRVYFPGGAEADRLIRNLAARELDVPIRIKPYRYILPAAADIALTAAGTVRNPGTAYSAPRIAVTCAGSGSLYIGTKYSVDFDGLSSGCIIDSDEQDIYAPDGITPLYTGIALDDFPQLAPGSNAISWTGAITKIVITPRWRDE